MQELKFVFKQFPLPDITFLTFLLASSTFTSTPHPSTLALPFLLLAPSTHFLFLHQTFLHIHNLVGQYPFTVSYNCRRRPALMAL